MSLKKNIIANYLGQGWNGLIGIVFMPFYIKYMGIEAYGLIGIFAILQAWMALLDMGMTPTLSREMARFTGGVHSVKSIRDLLRSVEIIGIGVAIFVVAGIYTVSGWLASDWLKAGKLPVEVVTQSLNIMGVVMALRFVENIYHSCIVGLQKQVILNFVTSGMATLRSLGALCVLIWVEPTIHAFFIWQGIVSVVTVVIFIAILYNALPASPRKGQFSWSALMKVWNYAAGIMLITLLSLLLTQTDKILLSRLLSLEYFGYYALAAMVANALYMLVTPIDQAVFPRFTALVSQKDQASLISTYHMGAQLITVLVGSPAIVLMMFGDVFLTLWTQNVTLAQNIAPLLAILSLGTLLNCFMHMPYQIQLAHGWTRLAIHVNIISVLFLVPAIFWAAPKYGAVGVAWVWVILNASYVLLGAHFMYQRLLITEKWRWYSQDIVMPLIAAALVAGVARWLTPNDASRLIQFTILVFSSILTLAAAAIAAPLIRQQIYFYITKFANSYHAKRT